MSLSNPEAGAVLIVEDEMLIRLAAVDFLEDEGFTVIEAANGDEGLASLRERREIRLLFTDIHMPGSLDGIRLAHIAAAEYCHVHILIVSGDALPEAHELPAGAHFLSKPYEAAHVVEHAHRAIRAG